MRQLQRVLWTKGILLSPQHLQLQDRYLEDLLAFHLGAFSYAPWGFSHLELDREALAGGSLAIPAARGLFPDGLPLDVPGADLPPAPKTVDAYWQPDQTSMQVYLAVPEHRPGGQNVSMDAEARHTRFLAEVVTRRDENTGLAEKSLQVGRRNLRIVVEGEALEGNSLLPVARVLRSSTGELRLDERHVPPLLDISATGHLPTLARGVVEILSAKSSELSGTRRQRNRSLADFGSADAANFWLLHTVNTHLPVLRHLYEVRRGHPEALYGALLALAGALTAFSPSRHAWDLPAYDHLDLGGCFGSLETVLRELLETVVPANHVVLPLRQTEPLVHATALDDDRFFGASQVFLGVRAGVPADEIARRAPQLLKVSSGEQLDRLMRLALPGIELRHTATPPASLPAKLEYQYFALDRAHADWAAVRSARNLAVYVPSDFPEPRLELIVLLPTQRS